MAEICQQLLAKGMKVYVQGSLTTRSWEDEASGVTKYKTEIRMDEMILLDSKGRQGAGMDDQPTEEMPMTDEAPIEDEPKAKKSKKAKEEKNEDPLEELPF
jgi:single-strand DNA-binding protein